MRIGSLFSGAGGLDMAVEQFFHGRTAWHCENNIAASKVLAHRWPNVPNLNDITQVNWKQVELIDILCAGWPCQPFSTAGKRKGITDERALWPHVAQAVGILQPDIVVLENVSNIRGKSGEFTRVANSMAQIGYDMRWVCLRASDVGAPHRRERVFIVAYPRGHRLGGHPKRNGKQVESELETSLRQNAAGCGDDAADASRDGRYEGWTESTWLERGSDAAISGAGPVDLLPTPTSCDHKPTDSRSDHERHSPGLGAVTFHTVQWGKYAPTIARWEHLTRTAPSPTAPNTKGNPRLSAAFSEWMMGWPEGWVTQVPGISRNDQLRIIGNGVVPQQAMAALRFLFDAR